ncbi:MAG TPA: glycosyltransferase family 1 protein [Candidatus Saccharimonadia bacterium]|nr:glycosyltransferase family 1 protein [Candidatus Saccharimonadia bacterium]
MKIAIDARIIYTSTGRYVERLLHHLQELDRANEYVVLLRQADYDRWQPAAPNFTKVVADAPPYSLREQLQLAVLLYRLRVDLVHFTMPQQPILYLKPHLTTIHDLILIDFVNKRRQGWLKDLYKHWVKPAVFRVAMRLIVHNSQRIIVPTNFVKQQVVQRFGVPEEHVIRTYEAGELTTTAEAPYRPLEGKKFILCVGNAYPYKNLQAVIDALQLLNRPDYSLILVGKTDFFYEQLQAEAKRRQAERVIFAGFVSDEELTWLYHHAAAYVFASLSEGFGLPGLEAMLHGAPVVASDATCLPEVYGEAAHYFNPRDVRDIAAKIAEVLDDDQLRQRLIAAGHQQVQRYSWRHMAEETLAIYGAARRQR